MVHPGRLRKLLLISVQFGLVEVFLTSLSLADEQRFFHARYNVSVEFDDNVFESVRTKRVANQAAVFSIDSNINLLNTDELIAMVSYRGGFKKYVNVTTDQEPAAGSIGVNRIDVHLEKRLNGRFVPGFNSVIKTKNIFAASGDGIGEFDVPSEIGYLHGSGELYVKIRVDDELGGTLSFKRSFSNFGDFDDFNVVANQLGFRVRRGLVKNLSGGFGYSVRKAAYNRFAKEARAGTNNVFALDTEQKDLLQEFDLTLRFYRQFLFNLIYTFQNNDSNSYGLSYKNNRVTVLVGKRIAQDMLVQIYSVFQIKEYAEDSDVPIVVQLQAEESQNNAFVTKLSKSFVSGLEAELKYSWYRNESTQRELSYIKNVYSFALNYSY